MMQHRIMFVSPLQEAESRVADFCRKCVALSDPQQLAGDARGALSTLGHCTALLLQLGIADPAAWQPLVQGFVRLRAEQPGATTEGPAAAAQPAKRGRGAAGKKAAAAAAQASGSSSDSGLMLVDCLQRHAAQLPEGSIAAVAGQELQCWSTQQSSDSASMAPLARRLLQDAFPAEQQPAEHAGVLLALHQLGLPADDGCSGAQLLERAAAVLDKVGGAGVNTLLRLASRPCLPLHACKASLLCAYGRPCIMVHCRRAIPLLLACWHACGAP